MGNAPALREFELTLHQMLRTGQDLAARYQRGHIEKARAGLDHINRFAVHTEAQLNTLETGAA